MVNDFWTLVATTWQEGLRGVGINELIICVLILLAGLILRSFFHNKVIFEL